MWIKNSEGEVVREVQTTYSPVYIWHAELPVRAAYLVEAHPGIGDYTFSPSYYDIPEDYNGQSLTFYTSRRSKEA